MAAAGLDPVAHSDEVAVVGIVEVLRELPRIRQVFRRLLRAVEKRRPELAVLVDFPDFNLRLARRLHRRGVPVLYYVSPQVWAWRRRRIGTIARLVKRMLVLFRSRSTCTGGTNSRWSTSAIPWSMRCPNSSRVGRGGGSAGTADGGAAAGLAQQ